MHLCIVGADAEPPSAGDLRRLFHPGVLSARRYDRLTQCARVLATWRGRLVGLATYAKVDAELHVSDLAIDREAPCGAQAVLGAILDGLELACLAGGGRRIVMHPAPGLPSAIFRNRGYSAAPNRRVAGWLEKLVV